MNKIPFFSLFLIVLNSCQNTSTFTEHKTKNFSIEIRSDLNETNDLNDDAVLQFKNEFEELYLIVLEETKTDVAQYFPEIIEENDPEKRIELYADVLSENYEANFDLENYSGYIPKEINGSSAIEMTFNAVESKNGLNVFYYVTFIETDTHFYQILTWTLFNKKAEMIDSMEKMILSFKSRDQKAKLKKATKG
ncbi:hypothetical protein [Flavobacterium sp. U410]